MRKRISAIGSAVLLLSLLGMPACSASDISNENVLRVASWDEYIDMGGSDSYYSAKARPIYEEFEDWYYKLTGKKITVKYIPLQDNETMYNKIKMGDKYDILCPSEYMAQKMKAENLLQPFPEEFFDPSIENNYYAQNVSAYTTSVFEEAGLTGYIAGYMWGTTGFVFNPEKVSRDTMKSWSCLTSAECQRKITAKDNTRDSYFMGLGLCYESELLQYKQTFENSAKTADDLATYKKLLSSKMNSVDKATINAVRPVLSKVRKNLYGLETDEGKMNVVTGKTNAAYQWSGDAVYILDVAEEEGLSLEYSIPESVSNLWFDGWVMMKNANVDAATAFVNYVSMAQNAVRNMYYIGYTSCMAGEEVYQYISDTYSAEADEENTAQYDLSYFFGDGHSLTVPEEQTRRQLFAQYPRLDDTHRLVVMSYFKPAENERVNRMWNNIK